MRATTNPGGPGHDWVRTRFIVAWRTHTDAGTVDPVRGFHPATIADNPFLDDRYRHNLGQLDPVTRAQLAAFAFRLVDDYGWTPVWVPPEG